MKKDTLEKDTKGALLDAAEALFLDKGFEKVSIREITDAAKANVAAINYHFSGKVNLYRAVLSRCFVKIAQKKVALINALGDDATLYDIIEVYVRSHFEDILANPKSERLLQIVYHEISSDAVASDLVVSELITPIHQALHQAIDTSQPNLPDQFVSRCISSIAGQVLHFIRFRDVIKGYSNVKSDQEFIDEMTEHITKFSLQGIGSNSHASS
jgi:AcrR family transcriptional regulator